MGQRGPKPGQYKVRFVPAGAAKAQASGSPRFAMGKPKCPPWLSRAARAIWRERAAELDAAGVLALADVDLLATFCSEAADVAVITQTIDREGLMVSAPVKDRHGNLTGEVIRKPHPLLKVKDAKVARLRQLADALCIGAASRARTGTAPAVGADKPPGKLAEIRERIRRAREGFSREMANS